MNTKQLSGILGLLVMCAATTAFADSCYDSYSGGYYDCYPQQYSEDNDAFIVGAAAGLITGAAINSGYNNNYHGNNNYHSNNNYHGGNSHSNYHGNTHASSHGNSHGGGTHGGGGGSHKH